MGPNTNQVLLQNMFPYQKLHLFSYILKSINKAFLNTKFVKIVPLIVENCPLS